MSYYRYITGIYKSYWPELNRTLRSSSVPRRIPDIDTSRYQRASSVPPSSFYSNSFITSTSAMPFRDRAASVPPQASWNSGYSSSSSSSNSYANSYSYSSSYNRSQDYSHHTDFDLKVIDYMGKLERDDALKSYVKQARTRGTDYCRDGDYRTGFSRNYSYYDANKHGSDYLYHSTSDVLGSWKHYNLSRQTITERNSRAKSPLVSRELDRYYETSKRSDYIGDISSGPAKDFRYYSYRRVPYFGGSDGYQYVNKYLHYLDMVQTKY